MKMMLTVLCVAMAGVAYTYRDSLFTEDAAEGSTPTTDVKPVTSESKKKLEMAKVLYQKGKFKEAKKLYLELIAEGTARSQAVKELTTIYEDKGMDRQAHTLRYENAESDKERSLHYAAIKKLTAKTMNPKDSYEGERYIVKERDTLDKIAKAHGSTGALLQRLNDIKDARSIRSGQSLKIVTCNPEVLKVKVSLSKKKLYLYLNDGLFKVYSVGVGKKTSETPQLDFKIVTKLKEPDWTNKEGVSIQYGDKRNPLGTRWMGFGGDYSSFGIHGTNKPKTVGFASSEGCVRMMNKEVEELFDFCKRGTKVMISQ